MYNWTLSWAERPGGAWALFFHCSHRILHFSHSAGRVAAGTLRGRSQKILSLRHDLRGGVRTRGASSVTASECMVTRYIGEPIVNAYNGEAVMEKIKLWYDTYGFWGTLAAAITPIPYKIFTIASGVFQFPFGEFVLASVIGRTFRFVCVAGFIYLFGAKVKALIEKYFDWAA
jgi:membrane protein YqaA with SNARE-associated domain